ncbi:MAG: DUF6046 domain-containing protein [Chitinophagales bacterium]|nr:DUF6046 domain-containing protein [Chitinophagales bacterium]
MALTDREILMASLLGSKIAAKLPEYTAVQNKVMKHPAIGIPFLPVKNKQGISSSKGNVDSENVLIENHGSEPSEVKLWQADTVKTEGQFLPLYFRRAGTDDNFFQMPYEPLISVSGKNNIVKRSIAKSDGFVGTVKEHWSQGDYAITITGALYGQDELGNYETAFPKSDFEKLKNYCVYPRGLEVKCDLFQSLDIHFIVVESFDFPFSKGENVQAYSIQALSDYTPNFLEKIEE